MHKILSIRQPWAWLIVNGYKDIENRTWRTKHRGKFYVHAGLTMTKQDWQDAVDTLERNKEDNFMTLNLMINHKEQIKAQRGGIVGSAEITDCVEESASPWFFGKYGFTLKNAKPLPFVPAKGQLGFFNLPIKT